MQGAIRDFLYEDFGYGKIDDFVGETKDAGTRLIDSLQDTVLGTFRRSSTRSTAQAFPAGAWKKGYVSVPNIFPISDLEGERKGRSYLDEFIKRSSVGEEAVQRDFFLSGLYFFDGYRPKEIEAYIRGVLDSRFPSATVSFDASRGKVNHSLKTDDFLFYVYGSVARTSLKTIFCGFNAAASAVAPLSQMVSHYYAIVKSVEARDDDE